MRTKIERMWCYYCCGSRQKWCWQGTKLVWAIIGDNYCSNEIIRSHFGLWGIYPPKIFIALDVYPFIRKDLYCGNVLEAIKVSYEYKILRITWAANVLFLNQKSKIFFTLQLIIKNSGPHCPPGELSRISRPAFSRIPVLPECGESPEITHVFRIIFVLFILYEFVLSYYKLYYYCTSVGVNVELGFTLPRGFSNLKAGGV